MKAVFNREIRKKIIENGLRMCDVAKSMGVSPCHLSHLMGHELRQDEKERILKAIREATKERKSHHHEGQRI